MSYTIRGQIEDILFDTDVEEVHIKNILSLLTSEVEKERERLLKEVEEKVIGKYEEKVKAKSSEDMINNAWKIARNALREKQRKALSDIGGGK